MATLTETAFLSRKIIKYGGIALVVLMIGKVAFTSFQAYWKKIHPKPPPPPNTTFGKLVKINFPERTNLPTFNFKMETVSGSFPSFSNQARVYFMPHPADNLLNESRTKSWTSLMGFSEEPLKNNYEWRFLNDQEKTSLEVNELTRNFRFSYDWKNDLSITSPGTQIEEQTALTQAKAFLNSAQSFPSDLSGGPFNVVYYKFFDGQLIEVNKFEAQLTRINFFRQDIEVDSETKIRILPNNPKESNISLLYSPVISKKQGIIEAKYFHNPISLEKFATYPIKEASQAWAELIDNKGFIANLGDNSDGKIIVRRVSLAFFESEGLQNYLQPVYVFEGDRDFYAYVPAITGQWLIENTAN
jgi:hypothetical protein